MDQAQFERELAGVKADGDALVAALSGLGDGATDEQIAATKPRDPAAVEDFAKRHAEAARESSLAEARALAGEALAIFKTFAAAGATGGASGLIG